MAFDTTTLVNTAMDTLTAQWYNALVTGLGLSPDQFQLYQGPNSAMNTSQEMWNLFNAVPPKSINNYYNPSQINNVFTVSPPNTYRTILVGSGGLISTTRKSINLLIL